MRKIAHISDVHFGAEIPGVPETLVEDLKRESPDLVVVSGDLTLLARAKEFKAARAFLRKIPFPKLVVPGNHDIPWIDVIRRVTSPLGRYRKYITKDLFPVFRDEEILVLGIATPRQLRSVRGEVSKFQRRYLRERLCEAEEGIFKIVVTHHPFIPPPFPLKWNLVRRGILTLEEIKHCRADLLLSGHLHRAYVRDVKSYYPQMPESLIIAQAGTATSRRQRGESCSYNIVTVEGKSFTITAKLLRDGEFTNYMSTSYLASERRWMKGAEVMHP